MTLEEKEKLYTAIGYSGSSHNLALPKHVTLTVCLIVFVLFFSILLRLTFNANVFFSTSLWW